MVAKKDVKDVSNKTYDDIKLEAEKHYKKKAEHLGKNGKMFVPRKYHMTDSQIEKKRASWLLDVSGIDPVIRSSVDEAFFNPYRLNGAYYGAVQALFLLGGGLWHEEKDVISQMKEDMGSRVSKTASNKDKKTNWEMFEGKNSDRKKAKDFQGKIRSNFITMQRLGGLHPFGLKLKQAHACVDVKKEGMLFYYRLSTFKNIEDVKPYYNSGCEKRGRKKKNKEVQAPDKVLVKDIAPDVKNEAPEEVISE